MQNTLELKYLFYGFLPEDHTFEDYNDVRPCHLQTPTSARVQAIVWEEKDNVKTVKAIMEVAVCDTTVEKAVRKLKTLSKKQHGVTNVRVKLVDSYGGNIER